MSVPSLLMVAAMVDLGMLFKVQHSLRQCFEASLVTQSLSFLSVDFKFSVVLER